MKQIVDLQGDTDFQSFGLALLSTSPDSLEAWTREGSQRGIRTPLLSDSGNAVAKSYGVMRWAMGGEPGHTFVLVDKSGKIVWIKDYGAPEHGGLMYVKPADLVNEIRRVR